MSEPTILFQLRDRARQMANEQDRGTLKVLADRLESAIDAFAEAMTAATMREMNGLWAVAERALKTLSLPENPAPRGGAMRLTKPVRTEALRKAA